MERIYNGIVKENPVFIMMLGMCPALAVTTSVTNALGMGACTIAVLVISNIVISLVRNIIPDEVRLPAFIVIVASFVTIVELVMKAYFVELNASLGVYIPLIVVNCIILGRAEAYASKNAPLLSASDRVLPRIIRKRYSLRFSGHAVFLSACFAAGQGTGSIPRSWIHCYGNERHEYQDTGQ